MLGGWLAVHYRDMQVLSSKHPDVYKHFRDSAFVVHKTNRAFSSIALDHAHEEVNALVKGQGGAVGLTENPAALRRWMVAGPELRGYDLAIATYLQMAFVLVFLGNILGINSPFDPKI